MYRILDASDLTEKRATENRESAIKSLYSIGKARAKAYGTKPLSVKYCAKIIEVVDNEKIGYEFNLKEQALIVKRI